MIYRYLTTVLKEAEYIAEQHDWIARMVDDQAHEYLRYAVLRVLKGEADHPPAEAVAPDGGRTGDIRDRLVVNENAQSKEDLEPRTKRAVD